MKTPKTNCQNCKELLNESFEFCPKCGQKVSDNLTLGVLFYNTISNYFSFDARFFKSFIPLLIKPGYIAKEFVNGRRLKYLHPSQMYLFVIVIFFFIFNFYVRDGRATIDRTMQKVLSQRKAKLDSVKTTKPLKDSLNLNSIITPLKNNSGKLGLDEKDVKVLDSLSKIKIPASNLPTNNNFFNTKIIDSLIAINAPEKQIYKSMGMPDDAGFFKQKIYTQYLKIHKTLGFSQALQSFVDSIPLAMFFLMPIFAFLLKLFYFRKGVFAHHLVFSFYFFTFLFTVFSIVFGLNLITDIIPVWIYVLIVLSTFFYLYRAIMKFYDKGWFFSFIKTSIISFLFLIIVLPLAFIVQAGFVFLFY